MKTLRKSITLPVLACAVVTALALVAGLAIRQQPTATAAEQEVARHRLTSLPVLGRMYFVLMHAESASDKPVS